ncbi:MAG: LysM domain-containing protein [Candidatus Promineifilaceae bacterium]|nr:LysM domain-containing protein [Candidatus Promineifilaceae bacterium]
MIFRFLFIAIPLFFARLILQAVTDRGSRSHATGKVSGSTYTVAEGDTFYSIGLRFGLPHQDILRANNLAQDATVPGGYRLIIPGLQGGTPPVQPPPVPPAPGRPFLYISSPTAGSTLSARQTVVVTGTAGHLKSSQIVVRVKDTRGPTLKTVNTVLSSAGSWRADFPGGVPVRPGSAAVIQAEAPGSNLKLEVTVNFR